MDDSLQKYEQLRQKTLPGLLWSKSQTHPREVAYRSKKLGIYQERSWMDFCLMVAHCALGLKEIGLSPGDRMAIMGDPREEYTIAELAAQSVGAIPYGIYPTSSPKEVHYLIQDGGASVFVAEDQEHVDRVLPLMESLPNLKRIIVIDTRGVFLYDHPSLMAYEDVLRFGQQQLDSSLKPFETLVQQIKPSDPMGLVYTSGTTGSPKGVVLSHGKHVAGAYTLIDCYPILAQTPHRTVVFLPLCHVLGKDVAITLPLLTQIVPHYGEDIEDLNQTIFEVAPTVLFMVPRYLQKYASGILVGCENSTALKKAVYRTALKIGRRYIKEVWEGKKSLGLHLAYGLLYQAAFRPILNKIGFAHLQLALSAGAPLPPEVMALWQMYGVNLSEFYGQTETGGAIISAQKGTFPRPGDVGQPPRGWEITFSEIGEILVRGQDIFDGYWKNPEATQEVIDPEGRLHTGDVGEWDAVGNLKIIDRARDIIVTSGGKTLSPTYIENLMRSSPYINEVVVFGQNRKYLTALIEIDYETVSDWARVHNIPYVGFSSLAGHPEVFKLIQTEIKKANEDLARVEQIKTFRIIPKELNPEEEDEPVTPTRKVKRQLMYSKFQTLIESMYDSQEERLVASEIGDVLT
ncbi:MAG: AMP-binding protein [Deltaproteobacteria bacterium]|nr:AMP-binding protein [Deltaproteobacteria bacterium]